MNRVKEIQDKEKAPKLDVAASKRFVKSALWQAAQKSATDQSTSGRLLLKFICYLLYHDCVTANYERYVLLMQIEVVHVVLREEN